jgi:hypothetical protein
MGFNEEERRKTEERRKEKRKGEERKGGGKGMACILREAGIAWRMLRGYQIHTCRSKSQQSGIKDINPKRL